MGAFMLLNRRTVLGALAATVSAKSTAGAQTAASPDPIVLTAAPAKRRLRAEPAMETDVWAYNGETPGPVLRLKKGETTVVRLVNNLPQPTSLHIHGMRHGNIWDGVAGLTQQPVEPGQYYEYRITPQDSGTSIYMPFVPSRVDEQMERGLSGMVIVEDENWEKMDDDVAVLLDDWRLTDQHQLDTNFAVAADNARLGRLGNTLTVNGRPGPLEIKQRPGARIRVRIGGVMNARVIPMRFEKMVKATVIAIDGQPCEPFDPLRRQVIVAPGSRYDVVLDLPNKANEETLVVVGLGDGMTVVRFLTEGEPMAARPALTPLPPNPALPPAIRLQEARRAELNIAGGWDVNDPAGAAAPADIIARKFPETAKIWNLNFGFPSGVSGKPLFSVRKGAVAVVAITNRSPWAQVITTHGHVFRVLHAYDDGWEPFFMDTVIVPENRTVRIAFIADNPGKWLIRSAILEHMEGGVMAWYEVLA
jgi:FtsP/CotA-like multicopper oxidase with cupredoxin domain